MANSMTGYGSETIQFDQTTIKVEIKSVNHRFLDIQSKIPRSILFIEEKIKSIIKEFFMRGRVELYISIEGDLLVKKTLHTDWSLMDDFMKQVKKAKSRYELTGDIPVSIISTIPDLITVQELEQQPSELKDVILDCTRQACQKLKKMRQEEGAFLVKDVHQRLQSIQSMVDNLKDRRSLVIEEYRQRILERIKDYLGENFTMDDSKIHQEIAMLAEKGDIAEEITRLNSHINHFNHLLTEEGAIGRKMDFIAQEMHREINTIGSKSTDEQIGKWTVNLKSEVEKIKEQIQNIE